MVFDFYPWNLDVDVEGTRLLYRDNDYAGKRKVNERFWQAMSDGQKRFFHSLGVDFMRVEADEKLYNIPDDGDVQGGGISMKTIHFLLHGSFLAIPDFQGELYKDAEVFGSQVPDSLKIVRMPQEWMVGLVYLNIHVFILSRRNFRSGTADTCWEVSC